MLCGSCTSRFNITINISKYYPGQRISISCWFVFTTFLPFYFVIVCIIPIPNCRAPTSWTFCCSLVSFPLDVKFVINLIWVLVTWCFRFPCKESTDQDFVVKFKSEIFSWKNFSQLLRQHNITLPHENDILAAVLEQKNSSAQSCQGRCFMDERTDILHSKTCFCDKACITFRDCCLDFHLRYVSQLEL